VQLQKGGRKKRERKCFFHEYFRPRCDGQSKRENDMGREGGGIHEFILFSFYLYF